jgi:hypothetical protein
VEEETSETMIENRIKFSKSIFDSMFSFVVLAKRDNIQIGAGANQSTFF